MIKRGNSDEMIALSTVSGDGKPGLQYIHIEELVYYIDRYNHSGLLFDLWAYISHELGIRVVGVNTSKEACHKAWEVWTRRQYKELLHNV